MKKVEFVNVYIYNGVDRPDLGLINGCPYVVEDIRERGWVRSKEIKINGVWRMWASFTEKTISPSDYLAGKRDSALQSILSK